MQTPLQAPICLWAFNQETNDTANSHALISRLTLGVARGYRPISPLHDPPPKKKRKEKDKETRRTSQPPANKGGGTSRSPVRNPADTLLTRGHRWENRGCDPWDNIPTTPFALTRWAGPLLPPAVIWTIALSGGWLCPLGGGQSEGTWLLGLGGRVDHQWSPLGREPIFGKGFGEKY